MSRGSIFINGDGMGGNSLDNKGKLLNKVPLKIFSLSKI